MRRHRPGGDSLVDTALLFLRLGTTAFGGPAAHIALMEDEVVRRRAWLTRDEFLDYLGATNFIPGPNSTELAIHIGMARHGWPGLLAGGKLLHPALGHHRRPLRVGVCSLWLAASGRGTVPRHHAGGHRDHRSGVVVVGP